MITQRQVPFEVAFRNEFTGSNIHAEWVDGVLPGPGQLPWEEQVKYRQAWDAADEKGDQLYIVFSYRTPIAWGTSERLYVPDVKYSSTTSRHQSLVRRAL